MAMTPVVIMTPPVAKIMQVSLPGIAPSMTRIVFSQNKNTPEEICSRYQKLKKASSSPSFAGDPKDEDFDGDSFKAAMV